MSDRMPESIARHLAFLAPSLPLKTTKRCRCGKAARVTKAGNWGRHDAPYTGGQECGQSGKPVKP